MVGVFATIGIAVLMLIMAASWGKGLLELFEKRRKQRQFSDFEDVLTGDQVDPDQARKFFAGEVKLEQEVYVFIPGVVDWEPFAQAVADALESSDLGAVIRGNTTDDSCGFDVTLKDFVNGVDLLRRTLLQLNAPRGTLIEYSRGDLPIHDD